MDLPAHTATERPQPKLEPGSLVPLGRRLRTYGAEGLADFDLVALVLGGSGARHCARTLERVFGSLDALAGCGTAELSRVPGVGRVRAERLHAALELGRRALAAEVPPQAPIRGPQDAARALAPHLAGRPREHFVVMGLDVRHRLRCIHTVAIGSLAQVEVHPREVFRPLVAEGAYAAIAAHNHPSGDPMPSREDLDLTRRLAEAGRIVGIPLLDHLVVSRGGYCSLQEMGHVPDA